MTAPSPPASYLLSWREILAALGRPQGAESRRQVRRLNDLHDGPILFPCRGGQPRAERGKLLAWWAGLEAVWAALEQRRRDRQATVRARHPYGRMATVVPEISGTIKPRRARKPRKTSPAPTKLTPARLKPRSC